MLRKALVALVICAVLVGGFGSVGGTVVPFSVGAASDRLCDELLQVLSTADPDEAVPVIVLLDRHRSAVELAERVGAFPIKYEYQIIPGFAADLSPEQIRQLGQNPAIRRVEFDRLVYTALDSAGQYFGVAQARADFGVTGDRDGSENSYSPADVVIAVIDTGIDAGHADLQGKVIGWRDWVGNRPAPYDDHGHGTHVAAIAAGAGAANPAYKGVAPGAALIGLKVLNAMGSGSLSNVVAALDWAVTNRHVYGIDIINMSLGTSGSSDGTDSVSQAVNAATAAGITVVVAAGNSGPNSRTVGSPGAAAGAITVGAMADPGKNGFYLASFSSRGPTRDGRLKPDLVAPGVGIMAARAGSGNGYIAYSGTSMAAPFVAGVAALLLAADPELSPAAVRVILQETAPDWGPVGPDNDYGVGRLDAYAALSQAFGGHGSGPGVPGHARFAGTLDRSGAQIEHTIVVEDAAWPLAAVLIMTEWTGRTSPDFDLYLHGPDGRELARATGTTRQETIAVPLSETGTYTLRVRSYTGAGPYVLDVSAGLTAPDEAPPPTVSIIAPEPGAQVAGVVEVVAAADAPAGLGAVELRIDAGAWLDITDNRAGDYHVYHWDTRLESEGLHSLQVRVSDLWGRQAVAEVEVEVQGDAADLPRHLALAAGRVAAAAPNAWFDLEVWEPGFVDLHLAWDSAADLDLYVYAPDGRLIGQAYTLAQPETLRVHTDQHGAGRYRVRVNLWHGPDTDFELGARGYRAETYSGSVAPARRNQWHTTPHLYLGHAVYTLSWSGSADLDLFVLRPDGREEARAYTLENPERVTVNVPQSGDWRARVNLYQGGETLYQLHVYTPAAVLSSFAQ